VNYLTKSIKDIFDHNIKLLGDVDKAVYYFREQQYDKALSYVVNSTDQIKNMIEAIIKDREYFNLVDTESMMNMLTGILDAKKNRDLILLADLLELQLISFLIGVQELIIRKEEIVFDVEQYQECIELLKHNVEGLPEELSEPINTGKLLEEGYRVEFTSCGRMTLATENEGLQFYFHTNSRVQQEAFLLAKHWYKRECAHYIILGLGLGYHINELQEIASGAVIEVYETDAHVLQLACAFTDLKALLLNTQIKIIYDPELKLLKARAEDLQANEQFLVHYPSYRNIKKGIDKEFIEVVIPWNRAIEAC
jgi:hypothetical protein